MGIAALLAAVALAQLFRTRHLSNTGRITKEIHRQFDAYGPEVLLYFSLGGSAGTSTRWTPG